MDDDNDDLTSDDLTADLDLGFDGAEDILRSWRKGMRPDPDLTVSRGDGSGNLRPIEFGYQGQQPGAELRDSHSR